MAGIARTIAFAIAPAVKFLRHPCTPTGRRISQRIGQRLRARPLNLIVPGAQSHMALSDCQPLPLGRCHER